MAFNIFIFLIQFNVTFKIISSRMRLINIKVGGRKHENQENKTPGTPANRSWLVLHVSCFSLMIIIIIVMFDQIRLWPNIL